MIANMHDVDQHMQGQTRGVLHAEAAHDDPDKVRCKTCVGKSHNTTQRRRHWVAMRMKLLGRHLLSSLEGVRGAY